ncbi:MAG: LysM peptidoglycan-binding domain-containing protein [Eubacteriales bacterium]
MMLPSMRFKTFIFPHNPRTYQIEFGRDVVEHKVPNGTYVLQNLGRKGRILRGSGEFYGDDAYDTFKELATLFYSEEAGELYHPIWQTSRAYFIELTLNQEPREDYVSYSFAFQEGYYGSSDSGSTTTSATTHRVAQGETLWTIAALYGTSVASLLAKNTSISNANTVAVGTVLAL